MRFRANELESRRVMRGFMRLLLGRAREGSAHDITALRAEVERLQQQNEKMKRAMRQCIDCEYRIEVMASRSARGLNADGSAVVPDAASARRSERDRGGASS